MARVISTVFFDGQFWIALIEKYDDDGSLRVGKHTFGPEPSNTDLLDFYLNKYAYMKFHRSDERLKIKNKSSIKQTDRKTVKSFEIFKEEQKKYLKENKKVRSRNIKDSRELKYKLKAEKKKEKKRGR